MPFWRNARMQGWDEGVPKMSLGEKAILRCSSDYAYGPDGAGGVIPPNAGEWFGLVGRRNVK